jgi:hypothetical protein
MAGFIGSNRNDSQVERAIALPNLLENFAKSRITRIKYLFASWSPNHEASPKPNIFFEQSPLRPVAHREESNLKLVPVDHDLPCLGPI